MAPTVGMKTRLKSTFDEPIQKTTDALTTDRPYRKALSPEAAIAILRRGRDAQWDPRIVDAFMRSMGLPNPPVARLELARQAFAD